MTGKVGWLVPVVLGIVIEICMVGLVVLGDLASHVPAFFLLFGLASGAYLGVLLVRQDLSMWAIWGLACLFRLTLLITEPSLSDDIYRYIWDGRVFGAGINPFQYPPASEHLAFLRDALIFPKINHATLPTIYPPVSQFFFLISYWVFDTVWGLKLLVVVADLMIGGVLVKLLQRKGIPPQGVVIYLWHPLVVLEGAGSGHIDFLGVLGIFVALWLWFEKRDALAFSFLGGAVLSKFLPLLIFPALVRWANHRWPKNWREIMGLPVILGLGYVPFLIMQGGVWGSLGIYAENWVFNSPLFWGLSVLVGDGVLARKFIAVAFGLLILATCFRRFSPLQAGSFIFAGFIFLTPTLHPWYMLWLIPFLVFSQNMALVGVSLAVVSAYHVLIGFTAQGVWEESVWVWIFEFGVFFFISVGTHIYRRSFDYGKS